MIMSNSTENHTASGVTSVKLGARKQALSELAIRQKRSVHSLLIEAVDRYIDQTRAKMQYEQDAINSYEHFQATGLFVTIEEMEEWATSLSTSTHKPLPQCHK
jgi:predicted transcriptional regulator